MSLAGRALPRALCAMLVLAAASYGHNQKERLGGPQVGPSAGARRGMGFGALSTPNSPKPLVPDAKPVRSCESLATVSLPDTAVESAAVDRNHPGLCRVTAFTTDPPTGDKAKIWIGIPTVNCNGRFMGTGGAVFPAGMQLALINRLLKATPQARRIRGMRAGAAAELAAHSGRQPRGHTRNDLDRSGARD